MREFAPVRPTAVVARWRREPVSGSPQRRGRPRGPSCGSWTTTGTVTVLIEKPAKAERMYPITEVEAL